MMPDARRTTGLGGFTNGKLLGAVIYRQKEEGINLIPFELA